MREMSQLHVVRAVAMTQVFFAHLWFRLPETILWLPVGSFLQTLLDRSNIGVVLFNMTTGLVLSTGLFGAMRPFTRATAWEFYKKRLARICPPYFTAVVLFALLNALLVRTGPDLADLPRYFLFLQNLSTQVMVNDFAAYWWLALLAQFYLAFPLVFNLFVRLGPTRALAVVCLACWSLGYLVSLTHAVYQAPATGWAVFLANLNLLCRLPDFAAGMWLGWLMGGRGRSGRLPLALRTGEFAVFVAAVALLALAAKGFGTPNNLAGFLAWNLALAAALFGVIGALPWFERLGRHPVVKTVSVLSFSFYLVHMPAQVYVRTLTGAGQPGGLFGYLPLLALTLAVAYALARLLDRLVALQDRLRLQALAWIDAEEPQRESR